VTLVQALRFPVPLGRLHRFLTVLRRALVRSLEDDAFGIAKAAAYSAILSLFPALLVLASVLAAAHLTESFLQQLSYALGQIFPSGTSAAAMAYFEAPQARPLGVLATTAALTWWSASGVVMSWMEGFRFAYQLPKTWGMLKERAIALTLVLASFFPMGFATVLVAFGNQIENWMIFHSVNALGPYILLMWTGFRWLIAALTSVVIIAVIYHFAVPRLQPWHTVLPGATLATAIWFPATLTFGWYLTHVADYKAVYGPLGVGIALLVWLYIVSLIVLFGAEVNALLYPRAFASQGAARAAQPAQVEA